MKILSIIFILIAFTSNASIDRTKFFKAFESNSLNEINSQITFLKRQKESSDKNAFLGALLMKKASFSRTSKEKITIFNEGNSLLEAAIKKHPRNLSYHLLRLVIQENCPKILKYHSQIKSDAELIQSNLDKLDSVTKKFAENYARTSTNLNF